MSATSKQISAAIRMSHWRRQATEGTEFWISCKRPAFLSNFSHLRIIRNSAPSVVRRLQCDIWINNKITLGFETKRQNTSTYSFLSNYMVPHSSQETFTNHKFCWCVVLLTERRFCFQLLPFFLVSCKAFAQQNKLSWKKKVCWRKQKKSWVFFFWLCSLSFSTANWVDSTAWSL